MLFRSMTAFIDVIVPRGGKSLVARVQQDARVPVMAHLEGICHTYVHAAADLAMARKIVVNAKLRRTGICGATETVLIDRACAATHLAPIVGDLIDRGCEVRGDVPTQGSDRRVKAAVDSDWGQEFLDAIVAIRVVDGIDEALAFLSTARDLGMRQGDATADSPVQLFDPVPMPLARLKSRERAQLLIEAPARPALHDFLAGWLEALRTVKTRARWQLEVDPAEI